jgi:homeobox protein YOX1/YHP1
MQPSVAGYPSSYTTYPSQQQANALGYPSATERRYQGASLPGTAGQMNPAAYTEARISTPRPEAYPQASSSRVANRPGPYSNVPTVAAPIDPTMGSAEQSLVKKKRKRADATQLKVLNEVYTRTAFPSTEERADLARRLDMSPRSVQIW